MLSGQIPIFQVMFIVVCGTYSIVVKEMNRHLQSRIHLTFSECLPQYEMNCLKEMSIPLHFLQQGPGASSSDVDRCDLPIFVQMFPLMVSALCDFLQCSFVPNFSVILKLRYFLLTFSLNNMIWYFVHYNILLNQFQVKYLQRISCLISVSTFAVFHVFTDRFVHRYREFICPLVIANVFEIAVHDLLS